MSELLKPDGTLLSTKKQFCEIGMDLIIQAVQPIIDTKDPDVVKLVLVFGVTQYERRIPRHEATTDQITKQWSDMLGNAFGNHEIGRQNRGVMIAAAQNATSVKPKLL